MKANVKSPGLKTTPVTTELNLSYADRYADKEFFDAYTRLILEVIHGRQATFVRDDELKEAWAIFTPLLHRIERERVKPILYDFGGRGPPESDQMLKDRGYYEYHGGEPLLAPVRPCSPLYAPARPCTPLYAPAGPCTPLCAPVRPCSPLLAPVRPCSPLYAPVRPCSPLFAPVRPCSPLFTPVRPCSCVVLGVSTVV